MPRESLPTGHDRRLAELDGGKAARIVDKMPDNYVHLGLIAALFPNATLIHCRRDFRDVAVSCWLTGFRSVPLDERRTSTSRRDFTSMFG